MAVQPARPPRHRVWREPPAHSAASMRRRPRGQRARGRCRSVQASAAPTARRCIVCWQPTCHQQQAVVGHQRAIGREDHRVAADIATSSSAPSTHPGRQSGRRSRQTPLLPAPAPARWQAPPTPGRRRVGPGARSRPGQPAGTRARDAVPWRASARRRVWRHQPEAPRRWRRPACKGGEDPPSGRLTAGRAAGLAAVGVRHDQLPVWPGRVTPKR